MSEIPEDPSEAVEAAHEQPASADEPVPGQPEIRTHRDKPPWKKIGLVAGGALLAAGAMVAAALRAAAREEATEHSDDLGDVDHIDADDELDDDWDDEDDDWGYSYCSTCDGIAGMQYCPECHRVDLDA